MSVLKKIQAYVECAVFWKYGEPDLVWAADVFLPSKAWETRGLTLQELDPSSKPLISGADKKLFCIWISDLSS